MSVVVQYNLINDLESRRHDISPISDSDESHSVISNKLVKTFGLLLFDTVYLIWCIFNQGQRLINSEIVKFQCNYVISVERILISEGPLCFFYT